MRCEIKYSAATSSPNKTVESIVLRIPRDSLISEKNASLSPTGSSITCGRSGFP